MRKKIVIALLCISCVTQGCKNYDKNYDTDENIQREDHTEEKDEEIAYCKNVSTGEGERIIYSMSRNSLLIYNTKNYNYKKIYTGDNRFAYNTNGNCNVLSVGYSFYNYFSLIKNDFVSSNKLCDIDVNDSIFPFGEKDELYFCIYNVNDLENINKNEKIVSYDNKNNEFKDIVDLEDKQVVSACLIDEDVYYCSYDKNDDNYELYKYNMKDESNNKIKDMETYYIYNYKNQLVYVDEKCDVMDLNGKIYFTFKQKEADIDYNEKFNLFFQEYASEEGNVCCDIWSVSEGKKIISKENYLGYYIENNKIYICSTEGVFALNE